MKTLNATATRIFRDLVAGLQPGEARRIDNAPGAYMAVSVDCLGAWRYRDGHAIVQLFAVAHRFEQNGDLVPDPDVEFMMVSDGAGYFAVSPTAIDQVLGYQRVAELEGGELKSYRPKAQADVTSFCNLWMKNIRAQQGDLAPKEVPTAA